jgi:hypothetical protein
LNTALTTARKNDTELKAKLNDNGALLAGGAALTGTTEA